MKSGDHPMRCPRCGTSGVTGGIQRDAQYADQPCRLCAEELEELWQLKADAERLRRRINEIECRALQRERAMRPERIR